MTWKRGTETALGRDCRPLISNIVNIVVAVLAQSDLETGLYYLSTMMSL